MAEMITKNSAVQMKRIKTLVEDAVRATVA
jgi:hypothetical protein